MRISDWSSDVCCSDLGIVAKFTYTHRHRISILSQNYCHGPARAASWRHRRPQVPPRPQAAQGGTRENQAFFGAAAGAAGLAGAAAAAGFTWPFDMIEPRTSFEKVDRLREIRSEEHTSELQSLM